MKLLHSFSICIALVALGCSNDPAEPSEDAGGIDAANADAGATDSGARDTGTTNDSAVAFDAGHDASTPDATTPSDLGTGGDAASDMGSAIDAGNDAGSDDDAGGAVTCGYQDAFGVGACAAFFGYAWDGATCHSVSGCSCEGADCANLYESPEACVDAHAPCSASCGGLHGSTCPAGAFCRYAVEDMCGATDALGMCAPIPDGCLDLWDPVCGCDGMTYSNSCYAAGASVSVFAEGECHAHP
ncbi:MAG: hypothetical protein IPK60_04320 [Sandaracinaceae bacterium]|nr:hypothetical protein [Sandaracinaceae bacterium]